MKLYSINSRIKSLKLLIFIDDGGSAPVVGGDLTGTELDRKRLETGRRRRRRRAGGVAIDAGA